MHVVSEIVDHHVKMQRLFVICVCFICVECLPVVEKDVAYDAHLCGVEASPSPLHRNPWLIHLEYYRDGYLNVRCAATLIGTRHAVTAAHCVRKGLYDRLVARLGEYDLQTEVDSMDGISADPVVRIEVVDVIIHEEYDGMLDHDIAVLVLEEEAPYTDFIRPICLPTGTIPPHTMFSASGWGEFPTSHIYSHVKKIIPLPHWTNDACKQAYKHLYLPEGVVCAGGEEGADTCRGDSGGPLLLHAHRVEIWGVTSSGNVHCGTRGSPGIYTSVQHHLEWIHQIIDTY
ncbi:trypsin domain-containing protein [Phthorimaea operculella]|nr:trypsin domain-containing protein [Phthorimaea operculella]